MEKSQRKPNILLMVADDLGRQLGCYGADRAQTPHLDALAAEGARFTHAFASTASCSGSRSVIYTGLHTHQNGMYGLACGRQHFQCYDDVDSGASLFNKAGYLTGILGKVHVGPPQVFPWAVRRESETRDVAVIADRAGEFLEQAKGEDKPFFLTVGFIDPHRDLTRGGFGNYEEFGDRIEKHPYKAENIEVPYFLPDLPGVRQEMAEYYQSINRMDQGVGMILSTLKDKGYADDTLVIFLSDNGPPFLNSKTTLYDSGVNLPLIIRAPGSKAGVVNPNMVSYVDLLPTMLDFAGVDVPASNGKTVAQLRRVRLGRSILPVLQQNDVQDGWDRVFGSHTFHEVSNYWPTRYIRTQRYKYHRNMAWRLDFPFAADIYGSLSWEDIRDMDKNPAQTVGGRPLKDFFFRPAEELYDLGADPREMKNIANDPEQQENLKELRKQLEEWQVKSDDVWLFRDGVSVLLNRRHIDAGLKLPDRDDLDLDEMSGKKAGAFVQSDPWKGHSNLDYYSTVNWVDINCKNLLLGAALATSAWADNTPSVSAPSKAPSGTSRIIDNDFVSWSFLAHFFTDYSGSPCSPNLFWRDVQDRMFSKTGKYPVIRLGASPLRALSWTVSTNQVTFAQSLFTNQYRRFWAVFLNHTAGVTSMGTVIRHRHKAKETKPDL